jgi:hypothetical protein
MIEKRRRDMLPRCFELRFSFADDCAGFMGVGRIGGRKSWIVIGSVCRHRTSGFRAGKAPFRRGLVRRASPQQRGSRIIFQISP